MPLGSAQYSASSWPARDGTLQLMLTGQPLHQLPAMGDPVWVRLDLALVHIMPSRNGQGGAAHPGA